MTLGDLDKIARRADAQRERSPFRGTFVHAPTLRERRLREYRAAFGMTSPPRLEPERALMLLALHQFLLDAPRKAPKATVVHVVGQAPDADHPIGDVLLRRDDDHRADRQRQEELEPRDVE